MFKQQGLQMFCLKRNKYVSNFHSLEVVGRGSDTQLLWVKNYLFNVAR